MFKLLNMLVALFGFSIFALLFLGVVAIFNKSLVKRKYVYVLLSLMIISIIGMNIEADSEEKKRDFEWEQKCSSVESVSKMLEGSVWTYTKNIDDDDMFNVWCKLVFTKGKLYYYQVIPSEGSWGEPQVCDYTIEERRYNNTGARYIGVFWGSSLTKYAFIPSEKSISYQGSSGYIFGGYLRNEDVFPWE